MSVTAKLFWSGNSQAIRLPKIFRLESSEVRIKKQGNRLIIEPITDDWSFLDELKLIDKDFIEAVNEIAQTQPQERDWEIFE